MADADPSQRLARSWVANAEGWVGAVREGRIQSRRVATDAAILDAVLQESPRRALDMGCGEGWLARALSERGVEVVGVDASEPLIQSARSLGGGTFHVLSYAEVAADPESLGSDFDAVIFNFALLGDGGVELLRALRRVLTPAGALFIQTVHPWIVSGDAPYRDGWRTEAFDGFGDGFPEPMPWYFRTLESWLALLSESGFRLRELREPMHPATHRPLSLLLAATVA